jgi:uncharacterized protein (DUF169 family)
MRLCAAIAASFSSPLVLPVSLVSCPGALRCLGLIDRDDDLVGQICRNTSVPSASVAHAVRATPRLVDPVVSVTLAKNGPFDVAVAYAQPAVVMNIVRRWQRACGAAIQAHVSTFMAICGNAVVAAHETGRIQLSLGCPTSRGEAVLRSDDMAIAIPRRLLETFFGAEETLNANV